MIPYSMTATSHVALTLGTSLALFMSVTITGLIKHQERFFDMFLPPNLPLALVPFMIALEIIGFLARSLSLGVRLTANMLAGHTLLKLICMLLWGLYLKGGVFVWLDVFPWIILFALCGLEFGVALIQSYVFTLIASSSIMKTRSSLGIGAVNYMGEGVEPWKITIGSHRSANLKSQTCTKYCHSESNTYQIDR